MCIIYGGLKSTVVCWIKLTRRLAASSRAGEGLRFCTWPPDSWRETLRPWIRLVAMALQQTEMLNRPVAHLTLIRYCPSVINEPFLKSNHEKQCTPRVPNPGALC